MVELNRYITLVNARLKELFYIDRVNDTLKDAMNYSVSAGGKRFRPVLHPITDGVLINHRRQRRDIVLLQIAEPVGENPDFVAGCCGKDEMVHARNPGRENKSSASIANVIRPNRRFVRDHGPTERTAGRFGNGQNHQISGQRYFRSLDDHA